MLNLRQRGLRHCVRLETVAVRGNGSRVRAIVTDYSLDGCCLIAPVRAGERITVKIPKIGELTADIKWVSLGRAGACFVRQSKRPLDDSGTATIEYALLAGLMALALVATLGRLGTSVESNFNAVNQSVSDETEFQT